MGASILAHVPRPFPCLQGAFCATRHCALGDYSFLSAVSVTSLQEALDKERLSLRQALQAFTVGEELWHTSHTWNSWSVSKTAFLICASLAVGKKCTW